ncbi:zinc finger MYM-type protein 1-like, partial [Aphis craccivora]
MCSTFIEPKYLFFFSASTYRWEVFDHCLSKPENVTVKRLSDTRWVARYETCLSLSRNWNEILKALNIFINNLTENSKTKCEYKGMLNKMNSLEMGILVSLSVLEIKQKSGELQKQYSQDLDISFMNECIHFRAYLKDSPEIISTKSVLDLCKIMKDDNLLDIYPYVNIA